ncbi:MAG: tRNA pseudouridine(55) synthase TruB [Clostridia bacterium]
MLRKLFDTKKIGHTGTLDPIAEGILIVCIGKTTRLADYIIKKDKTYKTEMLLGISTDTYDTTGAITRYIDPSKLDKVIITDTVRSFIGQQIQIPPKYSAKKVDGRKLYEYARNNEDVKIKGASIEIYSINDIRVNDEIYNAEKVIRISFEVNCSKGTYIRSLCNDIGEKLATGAVMDKLMRTAVGNFKVEDAYTYEQLVSLQDEGCLEKCFIGLESAIDLVSLKINEEELRKYKYGIKISTEKEQGDYVIKLGNGEIIGIGYIDSNGCLTGKVSLY